MTNTAAATLAQWAADRANGTRVHCTFTNGPAQTADGFCEFCGATDHAELIDTIHDCEPGSPRCWC